MTKALAVFEETTEVSTEALGELTDAELMRLSGQDEGFHGLPRLAINYEDDEEIAGKVHKLDKGTYTIRDPETGQTIYAETAFFQPFLRRYSYSVWDNEANKYTPSTIQATTLGSVFPDTAGGDKCGKLSKGEREKLPAGSPEAVYQESVKCNQIFYGIVTLEGKFADGTKASVTALPCTFYAKGINYMPISELIKGFKKQNLLMMKAQIKLATTRVKKGKITFYPVEPTLAKEVDFTEEHKEIMSEFLSVIVAANNWVIDQHRQNQVQELTGKELNLKASLEDDDVPF